MDARRTRLDPRPGVELQTEWLGRIALCALVLLFAGPSRADNCSAVANPPPFDCDTDRDGFGNVCDGDFDNDGLTSISDFLLIFEAFDEGLDSRGIGTDMDCDGYVFPSDLTRWLNQFASTGQPGPSSVWCAGSVPCDWQAAGVETRCNALGPACLCGEMLDTDQFDEIENPNGWYTDPQDSNSTKQCCTDSASRDGACANGNRSIFHVGPQIDISTIAADLESQGAGDALPEQSSVTRVWRAAGNGRHQLYGKQASPGVRRICYRTYFMADVTNVHINDCNNKLMESDVGDGQWIFAQSPNSPHIVIRLDDDWPLNIGDNYFGTGNLNWDSCRGHWCRIEACVYGGIDNDDPADHVRFEAYVKQIDGPGQITWSFDGGNPPGVGTGRSLGDMIVGHYMNACSGPIGYHSLSMQAEWPTDSPGQFIGPACEIEGC